jgi:hypothetical protein
VVVIVGRIALITDEINVIALLVRGWTVFMLSRFLSIENSYRHISLD